jgi:hypothetical protein
MGDRVEDIDYEKLAKELAPKKYTIPELHTAIKKFLKADDVLDKRIPRCIKVLEDIGLISLVDIENPKWGDWKHEFVVNIERD